MSDKQFLSILKSFDIEALVSELPVYLLEFDLQLILVCGKTSDQALANLLTIHALLWFDVDIVVVCPVEPDPLFHDLGPLFQKVQDYSCVLH